MTATLRTCRQLLLCGLIGLGAGVVAAADRVLPSEICRGLWIVPLALGDGPEQTVHLVLDTGAEPTSVDTRALERALGRPIEPGDIVKLRKARIGPFEIDAIRVGAFDLDHLDRALGRDVDGILGVLPFRDVLLTLDYAAEQIRVGQGRLARPDGRLIFRDVGDRRPMLRVDVAGGKEKVLVDSGSTGEFDLEPDERLAWVVEPRPVGAAVRFSRVEIREAGRMAGGLRFGPLLFAQPIVERTSGVSLAGYEVLRHFMWTFDLKSKRIRMQPYSREPIRLEGVRGIGLAFKPLTEGFEVIRVFSNTPAEESGLSEGDVVSHLDGMPISQRGCVGVGDDPNRSSLRLTYRRGGAVHEIDVPVATLVP